ncbi:DUF3307 domain-containing protein [Paenimyroides aestuarii]|uniref:DUF3307 domain-containing protein n=1 Tax=Paenimyroides aestuarii TaxID=2968490 RepID=A0ABY5NR09_9FLAO|nr:DUF3307 domain-containing protein [Paenimyroides aestuarii]UUV20973.1 DUF3307 domain-containing protein [Paenimyroides aestuarii]
MWLLLLKFLAAHFLGDFVFQTKKMVQHKKKSIYFLSHIMIHTALLIVFLWNDEMWWAIAYVVVLHAITDWLKLQLSHKMKSSVLFVLDQLLHFVAIASALMLFSTLRISLDFFNQPQWWLVLVAIILVTQVTAIFIRIILSPYQEHKKISNEDKQNDKKVLFNAGKYIGILERLFIFGFVVANFWEGIGFLLAAKSIFRFGDLNNAKERHLTEYVLIGTFLSFGCAILVGLIFNYVLINLI